MLSGHDYHWQVSAHLLTEGASFVKSSVIEWDTKPFRMTLQMKETDMADPLLLAAGKHFINLLE